MRRPSTKPQPLSELATIMTGTRRPVSENSPRRPSAERRPCKCFSRVEIDEHLQEYLQKPRSSSTVSQTKAPTLRNPERAKERPCDFGRKHSEPLELTPFKRHLTPLVDSTGY